MNWAYLRHAPWIDTRSNFVSKVQKGGALLDLGSSDGETLCHFAELRPDLRLFASDLVGKPERYPSGCQFHRGDVQKDRLPWPDKSMNAITCMHLVEHLTDLTLLFQETARLLKPGGSIYLETPHPKTIFYSSSIKYPFTINFYDDTTHTKPVPIGVLSAMAKNVGLEPVSGGVARNWLFAASWPLLYFSKPSRKKYTALVNWRGWSACLIARKR
jgi:ubiquinone/menaquinone biosynthesis C-methylase UbiE